MCRLFGQISLEPARPEGLLASAPASLLALSRADPERLQKDGWGVGFYNGTGNAKVVKSPRPLFEEGGRLKRIESRLRSRVIVGHIRAASNPRGLSEKKLVALENTQPFRWGPVVFAHNGTLNIPSEVERLLGPWREKLRGRNDSEVYFWQFMKFYHSLGSIPKALEACVGETRDLWQAGLGRRRGRKAPYTGLNTLVSDGKSLHALCHYPAKGPGEGRALLNAGQRWGTMSLAVREDRVLLASEDMDSGRWRRLRVGEIVSVEPAPAAPRALRVRRTSVLPWGGR